MSYMYWLCRIDFDSTSESVLRRIAAQQFADVKWSGTGPTLEIRIDVLQVEFIV
jgi:hypothetical protein